MSFKKYLDKKRHTVNGSQSETSKLVLNATIAQFSGYQSYSYDKSSNEIKMNNNKQQIQCQILSKITFNPNASLVDFGCSNGVIGLYLFNQKKIQHLSLVDHDAECILNLNNLIKWSGLDKIIADQSSFDLYDKSHDYVMTLSTIHWIYSATSNFGCLYKIIERFRSITKTALIIEWVDPSDGAIGVLHHIKMNPSIHKTAYTKENFLKALGKFFSSNEKIGQSNPTREIYMAYV